MKRSFGSFLFACVLFTCFGLAHAKGAIEKIVISGGGLGHEIEIRGGSLRGFDPWSGGFFDRGAGPVEAPRDQGSAYEVMFFMSWPARHSNGDRGGLQMIYNVRYCPGRDGGPGYIYLPGTGDKYSVNSGTIIREGDDGKWHRASAAWEALMKRYEVISETRTPLQSNTPNSRKRISLYGAAAIVFVSGIFMFALIIRHKRKLRAVATVR